MGVAAEIGECLLGAVEGLFAIEDPFFSSECSDETAEGFWVLEVFYGSCIAECFLMEGFLGARGRS
jgi:hypothetical protein